MKSVVFARFLAKKHLIFSPYFGRFLISVCESKVCKKLQNSHISEQQTILFKIIEEYESKCKINSELMIAFLLDMVSGDAALRFYAVRLFICV
ncbi:MAG: hypothetical protein SPJ90_02900 [Prevotella sp.]|nr:hypothetical protein [Prevotellaceae bacterium]MDY5843364.1 hypothetical protein [Prevotella sp.]